MNSPADDPAGPRFSAKSAHAIEEALRDEPDANGSALLTALRTHARRKLLPQRRPISACTVSAGDGLRECPLAYWDGNRKELVTPTESGSVSRAFRSEVLSRYTPSRGGVH